MDKDASVLSWTSTSASVLFLAAMAAWIWSRCKSMSCPILQQQIEGFTALIDGFIPKAVGIFILFILFKLIYSIFIERIFFATLKRFRQEERVTAMSKMARFAWWTLFFLVSLSIMFGDVGALLTSLGLVGFGLTFALQKPIGNFVGWLTIVMKGTYKEGDRIQVGNVKGDVREIQVMNTVVETLMTGTDSPGNTILYFPNEFVLTQEVQNYTNESNYVRDKLSISITYESDYHAAMKLLDTIVTDQIRKNMASYKRKMREDAKSLDRFLKSVAHKAKRASKKEKKALEAEAERLAEEKKELEQQSEELKELEGDFKPLIRIEMLDSAIELIVYYLTPYDSIKASRTAINLAFLDAVAKSKRIEVAYPHLQLVK